MRSNFLVFLCMVVLWAGVTKVACASFAINEIMYDLRSGSDAGREWVEVVNNGNATTTLAGWRLGESGSNHKLVLVQGSEVIPAGGFAVIAPAPEKFFADNPGFSGTMFDSSFLLSNTGETLVLRDANLAEVDSVVYRVSQGAAGDGNSLQNIQGGWKGAPPTPGMENKEAVIKSKPIVVDTPALVSNTKVATKNTPSDPIKSVSVTQEKITAEIKKSEAPELDQTASVVFLSKKEGDAPPLWLWLLGVATLSLVAIAGAVIVRQKMEALAPEEDLGEQLLSADDFEIIEADDEEDKKDKMPF